MKNVGKGKIAGEINLHAMAFSDGDGWWQIQKPIEDLLRGLCRALPEAFAEAISSGLSWAFV